MLARYGGVLLLAVAVFSMHGVQCLTADSSAGHAPIAIVAHAVVDDGPGEAFVVLDAADHHGVPAPAPAHGAEFWLTCLAVLLSGLTVLGAAAWFRMATARSAPGRASPQCRLVGWVRLPRPPDLFVLCLLCV
jgi:hypothetical protein